MICPNCSTANDDNATVCRSCGQPLTERKALAGFWRRYGAYCIDGFILGVVGLILYIILMVIGIIFAASTMRGTNYTGGLGNYNAAFGGAILLCMCLLYVVIFVIWLLYFSWFESSSYMGTPGKIAIGMQVVDLQGNRISFGKALVRNLAKVVSAIILGLGFVAIGFTEKKQGLHDIIAGTTVVMKKIEYL